jgi:hypothetical protein
MEQGISSGVQLVFQPGLGLIFVLLHFSFLLHLPREDFGRRTIFRSGVFPLPVLGPLPRIRFSRQSAPPSRFGPHFVPAVESLPSFSSLVRNYFLSRFSRPRAARRFTGRALVFLCFSLPTKPVSILSSSPTGAYPRFGETSC